LPIVLSAPHGGTLDPDEIPDRTWGVSARDRNTEELAAQVADALEARFGARPHVVTSRLHRRKLDPNRDLEEAAQGDARSEHAWREFHAAVVHAQQRVVEEHGTGLYLDLHGHGHPIARLELGYLLNGDALARSDAELDAGTWARTNSIVRLVDDNGVPFSALLRGPDALGTLLEARGFAATPSAGQPGPGDDPFFSGGYNTRRHGSAEGGPLSGIQIEAPFPGVRETHEARAAFAEALADALVRYFERWY
jgi:N-formylglutamate amidohydrolase